MIKTDLPEVFDDFAEQRKQGFITAKEFKENGGKIAGTLCSYTPAEVIHAAGVAMVGLCGMSEETIPEAERVLPKNLCPLIKSTYGFALTQKCPYTYFSDIIIGETTCDGKKKMYELLNDLKETYVLQLPQAQNRSYAGDIWYEEIKLVKEMLEEKFEVEITDQKLREAVKLFNRKRRAVCDMYQLMQQTPPPMTGTEMMITMQKGTFTLSTEDYVNQVCELVEKLKEKVKNSTSTISPDAKRILLTGCPSAGVIGKIGMVIEDNGGIIVGLDDCGGERTNQLMIDEEAEDILRAISDRYLNISCSVMSPNDNRLANTADLVSRYKVDGVIEIVLQACHTFNVEAAQVEERVKNLGVPYMELETDYSQSDSGQIQTRIAAFIEML